MLMMVAIKAQTDGNTEFKLGIGQMKMCEAIKLRTFTTIVMSVMVAALVANLATTPIAHAQDFSAGGVDMRQLEGQASECRVPALDLQSQVLTLRQDIREILACNAAGKFYKNGNCEDGVYTDHEFFKDYTSDPKNDGIGRPKNEDALQFTSEVAGGTSSPLGIVGGKDGKDLICVSVGPWDIGDYGGCNAACGSTGSRYRSVSCDFYRCISPSRSKPRTSKSCSGPPCPPPPEDDGDGGGDGGGE